LGEPRFLLFNDVKPLTDFAKILPKPTRRVIVLFISSLDIKLVSRFAIFFPTQLSTVCWKHFSNEKVINAIFVKNIFFQPISCKDLIFSQRYDFMTGDAEF